jgi:hypothetical protein
LTVKYLWVESIHDALLAKTIDNREHVITAFGIFVDGFSHLSKHCHISIVFQLLLGTLRSNSQDETRPFVTWAYNPSTGKESFLSYCPVTNCYIFPDAFNMRIL